MSVLALVERLAPLIEKELNMVLKSKEEAETLSSKLKKIEVGLHDAETREVTEGSVKSWLKDLEGVAEEIHDVLDELEIILNLQVVVEGVSSEASHFVDKARWLVLSLCCCFKQVMGRREVTKKMKALSVKIDEILSNKGRYKFVQGHMNDRGNESFQQDESTSDAPESGVVGLDAVTDSLMKKLKSWGSEEDNHIHTHIISIVGIGGLGKTTLAQCVYNDDAINGVFVLKGWVSVSEPFNASDVALEILEAFGDSTFATHSKLNTLCQRIKEVVKNKRFFLVLDNVWTIKRKEWESLKNCLHGAEGSRILVTTRDAKVAKTMGTTEFQSLDPLTDSECSTILNGIALKGRRKEEDLEKLKRIGDDIAKKCNGLPLAARFLGSMLTLKQSKEEWIAVLGSPLWNHESKVNDVFRILNFSYTDLSPTLKRCFLSIVVRSKDTPISVKKMIKIWMAYGYLNPSDSFVQVQSKGLEYFKNLEMRSFFQKCDSRGKGKVSYKLHNIMHEFATHVALEKECSFVVDGESVRLNYNWNSLGKLRTFCARNIASQMPLNALCEHLKSSVRLLSLRDCNLLSLPEEVGELLHLRYVDLSGNHIRKLPNTVSNLYYLQTLRIRNCKRLSSLPEGMEKLINLRYLINSGTNNLVDYPSGFGELTGLWTLKEFKGATLGCLGELNQIQGSLNLDLSGLSDSVEQFSEANLGKKTHIKKLILNFGKKEMITGVVEAVEPPPNLQNLDIESSGKWLSHWIHISFNNLKTIKFRGRAKHSDLMPPFGRLPALEKLLIHGCSFKSLSIGFLGLGGNANAAPEHQLSLSFPRLKTLRFTKCHNWEEWEDIEEELVDPSSSISRPVIMRCLEELEIRKCAKLKGLPSFIRRHTDLKIVGFSRYDPQSIYFALGFIFCLQYVNSSLV